MSKIGERIRLLREESGYSQAEFADKMGVNRMTINNYENSKRIPDIGFATNASVFFNVTLEYLTGKSEYRHREDMLESVHKTNRLMSIIEKMPQVEGQQMMTHLSQLLETANIYDVNTPILTGIINVITEFNKVLNRYVELDENILRTVAELRWQKVQSPLINWTCHEKTKAISENSLEAGREIFSALTLCTKQLNKKLAKLLEEEAEK